MESEATATVEANFRPPETRGNFSVETPADSGVMDINSAEYAEYKSQVEATDQARLAEVRATIAYYQEQLNEIPLEKANIETVRIGEKTYFVEYVPKEMLWGGKALGLAYTRKGEGGEYAQVREDLSPRVKRNVKAHELYHLQDTKDSGFFMSELRAVLHSIKKEPLGYLEQMFTPPWMSWKRKKSPSK